MGQLEVGRRECGEGYLDDENEDRVLGVVSRGIGSLEDTSLAGCSDGHGDSKVAKGCCISWAVGWRERNEATRQEKRRVEVGVSEVGVGD